MLKIEYVNIDSITRYDKNAKLHPDDQIDQIINSIKEFGFNDPIAITGDTIVEGHGRHISALKMGLKEVPIIRLDHLTDEQRKMYTLAHNKLTMNTDFDLELLDLELTELTMDFDVNDFGFDFELPNDLNEEEADTVPEIEENPCIKLGDLIELGEHRLLCGDSIKEEDVARLMDGKKADMVFTDPPYGVNYTGGLTQKKTRTKGGLKSNKRSIIANDKIDLYYEAVQIINKYCNGVVFMFYADVFPFRLYQGVNDVGGKIIALIIWKKNGGYGALNATYKSNHEPCLVWSPKGTKINFIGSTSENRIWEIEKDGINKKHPTQKPTALAERAISNHKANIVLDLFLGSGSTLIACENLSRKCYGMELDEKYAQIIIQRYCDYTSTDTIKINGDEVSWNDYKEENK